jgi:thioredoxin-like negative regulator of GroEL
MRRRPWILIFMFIAALASGAVLAWFAMAIPRDIRAEAMLREARTHLEQEERNEAREKFEQVVREYPRTDAAAAASVALFRFHVEERDRLEQQIRLLSLQRRDDARRISDLERTVERLNAARAAPPPAAAKPAPKKPAPKKPAPKRPAPKKRR